MKKHVIIFFVVLIALFLISNYIDNYKVERVDKIVDGDTLRLGDGKTIRLTGINAPETDEFYYEEAKEKLKELVLGKKVRLEKDKSDKDDYGRLLRYVYVDELFVNAEMIRLGLARIEEIEPNVKYSELFLEEENKARKAKRCIWK